MAKIRFSGWIEPYDNDVDIKEVIGAMCSVSRENFLVSMDIDMCVDDDGNDFCSDEFNV